MISKDNFFTSTIAEFIPVNKNKVDLNEPDFESSYGSKYFYNKYGVYRYADHWGSVASCYWALKTPNKEDEENRAAWASDTDILAFCEWSKFGEIIELRCCDEEIEERFKEFTPEMIEYLLKLEEYKDGECHLFYEFNDLFSSEMENGKIKLHPNHYNTEIIKVVKDYMKFIHLLDDYSDIEIETCSVCKKEECECLPVEIELSHEVAPKKMPPRKIRKRKLTMQS